MGMRLLGREGERERERERERWWWWWWWVDLLDFI